MTDRSQLVEGFWAAFQRHSEEFASMADADNSTYDLILNQLQLIDPELYFEFSSSGEALELVLTAEGNSSLFSLVESIVASAPAIPGWKILALKPKFGFPATATWDGFTLNVSDVVFDPLTREGSQELGLRMFVPNLTSDHVGDAHNALLRALDHALGEKEFAESVHHTEVHPLPGDVSAEDYIPLTDLEQYINWRRARLQNDSNGR